MRRKQRGGEKPRLLKMKGGGGWKEGNGGRDGRNGERGAEEDEEQRGESD